MWSGRHLSELSSIGQFSSINAAIPLIFLVSRYSKRASEAPWLVVTLLCPLITWLIWLRSYTDQFKGLLSGCRHHEIETVIATMFPFFSSILFIPHPRSARTLLLTFAQLINGWLSSRRALYSGSVKELRTIGLSYSVFHQDAFPSCRLF